MPPTGSMIRARSGLVEDLVASCFRCSGFRECTVLLHFDAWWVRLVRGRLERLGAGQSGDSEKQ